MNAADAREMWRTIVNSYGERVTLQRISGVSTVDWSDISTWLAWEDPGFWRGLSPEAKTVRGRVTGFSPKELTGGIMQGSRKVILLAEDVESSGFPMPIKARSTDRIVAHGKTMMVENVDTNTARMGNTLIAYLITATGG